MSKQGLLGNDNMLQELLLFKELGLEGSGVQGNDQIGKLLAIMSLQSNSYMNDMKDYTKASRKGGGGGGGGGRSNKNSGGGSNMMSMLEAFQSISLTQTFQSVETFLIGVEAGPDLSKFPAGYSIDNFGSGTNPAGGDAMMVKYILNTQAAMASAMQAESAAERTEVFYTMLESFDGMKTWGNSANTANLLPLVLLSGGNSLFGTSSQFTLPPARFT